MEGVKTFLSLAIVLGGIPSDVVSLSIDEIAKFSANGVGMQLTGNTIVITSDGLPEKIAGKIDGNAAAQSINVTVPISPRLLNPLPKVCMPPDIIGVAINGVPIRNPFTSDCCNAGLAEKDKMDSCWGKLDERNHYYYTLPPLCTYKNLCNENNLIGVALDGFPIYGSYDELGRFVDKSMLDECHGRVDFRRGYRYHITDEFPYMIQCFRGSTVAPTRCGCDAIEPTCSVGDLEQFITNTTCCKNASNCDHIYYAGADKSSSCQAHGEARLMVLLLFLMLTAGNYSL